MCKSIKLFNHFQLSIDTYEIGFELMYRRNVCDYSRCVIVKFLVLSIVIFN